MCVYSAAISLAGAYMLFSVGVLHVGYRWFNGRTDTDLFSPDLCVIYFIVRPHYFATNNLHERDTSPDVGPSFSGTILTFFFFHLIVLFKKRPW